MSSFIRGYKLTIDQTGIIGAGTGIITLSQDKSNRGLMIDFSIYKKSTQEPNQASISIINPSDKTIGQIQQMGIVNLRAGYDKDIATIFQGEIKTVDVTNEGRDTVLRMECITQSQPPTQINQFLPAGSTIQTVIQFLTDYIVKNVQGIDGVNPYTLQSFQSFFAPVVLSADVFSLLGQYLKGIGYGYFIDNGYINIALFGSPIPQSAVPVSKTSGLIGVPKKISEKNKDGGETASQGVEFQSILNYGFAISKNVLLTSRYINGLYKIDSLEFKGNSLQGDWVTNVRCLNG